MTINANDHTMRSTPSGDLVNIDLGSIAAAETIVFSATGAMAIGSIAWDGLVIRPDSVLFFDSGQHNGGTSGTLTDTTKSWAIDEWIGFRVRNTSDGSQTSLGSPATDSDATTVTHTLTGGVGNDWDAWDYYEIVLDVDTGDLINFDTSTNLGGTVVMTAKGVPTITGISGVHTFDVYITDISAAADSDSYTVTVLV